MIRSLFLNFTHLMLIALVLIVLLVARKVLKSIRLRVSYRKRLDRALPVIEVVGGAVFLIWCTWLLSDEDSLMVLWATGAMALGIIGAGWFAFHDLVSGVVLRSESTYAPGQWIQTDQVEGFIASLGYRTMEIETDAGLRIRLPYSQLAKGMLTTAESAHTARAHAFIVELPASRSVAEYTTQLRSAALNAFWASPRRDPHVQYIEKTDDKHRFEVTVFCLDEAHATDLERSVRRQIE